MYRYCTACLDYHFISKILAKIKQNSRNLQLDWTSNTSRQKINLPTNQKGYDKSETTDEKLSARRIQIYWVYFSVIIF